MVYDQPCNCVECLFPGFNHYKNLFLCHNDVDAVVPQPTVRKHTAAEHLAFMNQHVCTFEKTSKYDQHRPFTWCLFTVHSQHVYGNSVEECLDTAMASDGIFEHPTAENSHWKEITEPE